MLDKIFDIITKLADKFYYNKYVETMDLHKYISNKYLFLIGVASIIFLIVSSIFQLIKTFRWKKKTKEQMKKTSWLREEKNRQDLEFIQLKQQEETNRLLQQKMLLQTLLKQNDNVNNAPVNLSLNDLVSLLNIKPVQEKNETTIDIKNIEEDIKKENAKHKNKETKNKESIEKPKKEFNINLPSIPKIKINLPKKEKDILPSDDIQEPLEESPMNIEESFVSFEEPVPESSVFEEEIIVPEQEGQALNEEINIQKEEIEIPKEDKEHDELDTICDFDDMFDDKIPELQQLIIKEKQKEAHKKLLQEKYEDYFKDNQ